MTDDSIVARMREQLSQVARTPDTLVPAEEEDWEEDEIVGGIPDLVTPSGRIDDPYAGIRTRPVMGGRMAGRRSYVEDVAARREQANEEFQRMRQALIDNRQVDGARGSVGATTTAPAHEPWGAAPAPNPPPQPVQPPLSRPLNYELNRRAQAHMDETFANLDTKSRGELLDLIALMRADWAKLNEIHNARANRSQWCTEYEERQGRHNQVFHALKLMGRVEGGGTDAPGL